MAWSTTDKHASITLSNNNMTATHIAGDGYHGIRGDIGYTSGTYYFEIIVPSSGNEGAAGIGSASCSLTDPLGYNSPASAGMYDDGTLWVAYASYGAAGGGNFQNVRIGFFVNLTSRRLWTRGPSGTWLHGGNPDAGGAGIDIAAISGLLFPMFTGRFNGDTSTLYSTQAAMAYGLPTGATAWGDATGTPVEPMPVVRRPTRMAIWF